jgi:hypothetical protein
MPELTSLSRSPMPAAADAVRQELDSPSLGDGAMTASSVGMNDVSSSPPLSLSSDALFLKECMEDQCPRCRSGYIFDPDGGECFAIKCNGVCKAAFCAWCGADCGEDAHEHVANCPSNQQPRRKGRSSSRPVHSSLKLLELWRLKRRQAKVTTALKKMGRDKAAIVLGERGVAQTLRDHGLGDIVLEFASVPAPMRPGAARAEAELEAGSDSAGAPASSPGGAVTMTSTATEVIDVRSESDSESSIIYAKSASGKPRKVVSESDSSEVETVVAASGAAGDMQKSRAGKRWWGGDVDDKGADGITEAQFAEFAKTVATVPELDQRFTTVFSVRTSTLAQAGRGLFFNVAEASRLGLIFPLYLPLCGIARKAREISAAEKKTNGCLLDTGLCVQNEQVR